MTSLRLAHLLGLTLVACGPAPGGETGSQTDSQTAADPTGNPTGNPTGAPTGDPTGDPTGPTPTTGPVDPTTSGPMPTTGPGDATTGPAMTATGDVSTTTTGTTTGDMTTSDGTTGAAECEEFLQKPENELPAGLARCPDDTVHRHTAVMCAHPYEPNVCDERGGCDEPCDGLGDGSCTEQYPGYCRCAFPCSSDADCSADAACLCASGIGDEEVINTTECMPANCRTDADCDGFECGLSPDFCFGAEGLFCRSAADECVAQSDCPPGKHCSFETDVQRWVCIDTGTCE